MSEEIASTQPEPPLKVGNTQPLKPVRKKAPGWRSIIVSVVGVIALLALGIIEGYWSGIGERKSTESSLINKQLTEQFQYALVDEQFGRYDAAQQRLEFIIQHNPGFPGAQSELTKILVLSTIPTATPTPTITPTPDTARGRSDVRHCAAAGGHRRLAKRPCTTGPAPKARPAV